jgi:hypothetical protein
MDNYYHKIGSVFAGFLILIMLMNCAEAATLYVGPTGCNYTRIQDAINAATPGDTIVVYSGTYYERVNVYKQLTLRGSSSPIVDAKVPFASRENDTVVWNLPEIGPFETVTIDYTAEALWSGRFVNSVEVEERSVDGSVVQPVGAKCTVEVGEFENERRPAGWEPPDWDFVSVCDENCELTP